MKRLNAFLLVELGLVIWSGSVSGATLYCMSASECAKNCSAGLSYCCATGDTKTVYSCPTGWTLSGTNCTRTNTSAGSDDKGYKTNIYGSCTATAKAEKCYEQSSSSTDGSGKMCLRCMNI